MQTETTKMIRERLDAIAKNDPFLATTILMLIECIENPPGAVRGELLETEPTAFEYSATPRPTSGGSVAPPDGEGWTLDHDATSLVWKLSEVGDTRFLIWSREKPAAPLAKAGPSRELLAAVDTLLALDRSPGHFRFDKLRAGLERLEKARGTAQTAEESRASPIPTATNDRIADLRAALVQIRNAGDDWAAGVAEGALQADDRARHGAATETSDTEPPTVAPRHPAKLYRCAGPSCPGLPYRASDHPHPASCSAVPVTPASDLDALVERADRHADKLEAAMQARTAREGAPSRTTLILRTTLEGIDKLIEHARGDVGEHTRFLVSALEAIRPDLAAILEAGQPSRAALKQAIRAFTVDLGGEKPTGAAEQALLDLGKALNGGGSEKEAIVAARAAAGRLCIALAEDVRRLRTAAEGFLGGDFGSTTARASSSDR